MSVSTMNEASPASDNTTPVLSAVGVVKRFGGSSELSVGDRVLVGGCG